MSTALLENSIFPGPNKIRTSPLDHFLLFSVQISIQRCLVLTWERPIWNQNKTTRVAEMRELKTSTAQLDNSSALSPNKIKLHDHSSSTLFYNIIIHFNPCSVSISTLTCLFYRREVAFTIHHKFLLVNITLFQLSTLQLYSVVYLVCESKHVCDKVVIFSTSRALKNWQRRAFKCSAWNFAHFWRYIAPQ